VPPAPVRKPTSPVPLARTPKPRAATPPPFRTAGPRATVAPGVAAPAAIVIDDLGNERGPAERIASWREPVAGAVLPAVRFSADCARALSRGGKEILLHLPMEPGGYPAVKPGPGVILRSQSDEDIARTLEADLATVPGAVGVNNHMGSAATADPRVMRAVAAVLARRGLFFLDSRTTDTTVAERTAEESSVPSAHRRVFLDDVANEAAIRTQLAELVRRAREEGGAIAIGHPYPATLAVLEADLPGLEKRGVKLVRVGDLVR
jgi:polysaccharide deacetylase 2 family uncharacterized protein YibQ